MGQDVSRPRLKPPHDSKPESKTRNKSKKVQKRKSAQYSNVFTDGHNLSDAIPASAKSLKEFQNTEDSKKTRKKSQSKRSFKHRASSLCPPFEPLCLYKTPQPSRKQHVFIMRHGERMDHADPTWAESSSRPWDPPLTNLGRWQAYQVGLRMKREGWHITRIVTSPFLRCVETSAELASALGSGHEEEETSHTAHSLPTKPAISMIRMQNVQRHIKDILNKPKVNPRGNAQCDGRQTREALNQSFSEPVRVSLDYGLCEAMTSKLDPIENEWFHELEDLESLISQKAVVDHPDRADLTIPHWPECILEGISRLMKSVDRIADQFPDENLVLVTHAEAVHASVVRFKKARVFNIGFAAFSHLRRTATVGTSEREFTFGPWSLHTASGNSGVYF